MRSKLSISSSVNQSRQEVGRVSYNIVRIITWCGAGRVIGVRHRDHTKLKYTPRRAFVSNDFPKSLRPDDAYHRHSPPISLSHRVIGRRTMYIYIYIFIYRTRKGNIIYTYTEGIFVHRIRIVGVYRLTVVWWCRRWNCGKDQSGCLMKIAAATVAEREDIIQSYRRLH